MNFSLSGVKFSARHPALCQKLGASMPKIRVAQLSDFILFSFLKNISDAKLLYFT